MSRAKKARLFEEERYSFISDEPAEDDFEDIDDQEESDGINAGEAGFWRGYNDS